MNESRQHTEAYGLVAQAIAQLVFQMARHDDYLAAAFPEVTGPIFYHVSTSNLEAAASDLWRLGILRPLDEKHNWAFHFVFNCEVGDSNVVAERNRQHGPPFCELLTTFIDNFGELGTKHWGFSTKRDVAFGSDSSIKPTLEALASLGYLRTTEAGFVWTDLVAPIMHKCWFNDWPDRPGTE